MDPKAFIEDLKTQYPYQFEGDHIYFDVPPGWQAIFRKLVADIDAALQPGDRQYFHWVQLKEKFGTARFYCQFEKPDEEPPSLLGNMEQRGQMFSFRPLPNDETIRKLIMDAEAATASVCLECGEPGMFRGGGWVRTLCDRHEAEYQARQKEQDKEDGV